jgi:hypothetical protein
MATRWTVHPMRVARHKYDAAPLRNDQYIEAASASYAVGVPLQKNASAANSVETWTDSSTTIVGVSIIASTGSGSQAFIHELHEGTILEANATLASSAAFAQTDIGAYAALAYDSSSSAWVVSLANASSANNVRVTGLAGMAQIGDYTPRVEFEVTAALRGLSI